MYHALKNQFSIKTLDQLTSFDYQTNQGQLLKLTSRTHNKYLIYFFNKCNTKSKSFEKNHVSNVIDLASYNESTYNL